MKDKIAALVLVFFGLCGFSQTENDSIPKQLEEISVQANVKTISHKNGNTKIDVANSIYQSVPNTIDLLVKLPRIQISSDRESISIIGKGNPLIYIDNQKVGFNDLISLAVADIKTIEIINNPSSKYEAEGLAVILVTRKFSKKEGFRTEISETAAFKKKFNNYLGLNATIKAKTTEFKINFNYNHLNPWEANGMNYTINPEAISAKYDVAGITKRNQYIFGGSILQQLNDDDYVSFTISNRSQKEHFEFDTNTLNQNAAEMTAIKTFGNNAESRNFINSFVNYNNKIKNSNAVFFAGLQYSKYRTDSEINSFNNYNQTTFDLFQKRKEDFNVDVFSGRVDFEKKFTNELKWESGILLAAAKAETGFDMTEFEENRFSTSEYELNEQNNSVYTQVSGTLKKISWSAGLRVENTIVEGKFRNENALTVDKNYARWFPKLQIEIPVDSTKNISLNYAKSIERPNFSTTSQGMTYVNPYFAFASNINLNPTLSDEISATFLYKNKSVKMLFNHSSAVVNYGPIYNYAEQLLVFQLENFDRQNMFGLELDLPFGKGIWNSNNNINVYLTKIDDARAFATAAKPYLYLYSNQMFTFKNDLSISVGGWALTKQQQGVFNRGSICMVDAAVSKTFLKVWSCTLIANNIFKNTIYKEQFHIADVASKARYYSDTHEFSIALKYTFGKVKDSGIYEKSVDGTSRIR